MGEIILHLILLAISALFFKNSFAINNSREADPIGPAGFSQGILILIMLLLAISLYQAVKKQQKQGKNDANKISIRFFGILGFIALFIGLSEFLGFLISSFLLVGSLFYLLGQKQMTKILLSSVLISTVFTLIFSKVLSVPLPTGIEAIEQLSHFVY
ncbi:tripartite tricarboxylate transporter TctB family protein [Desmospora activa]|uniref:Tripartite tricarboxylate transporter TctB family protein n=1 Tax=Desmospora activa DSM 45169 TaxID=1121389 RepID=A0A2T4ZAX8_9BACL|nr:tripartite tricarboxylate transporter TctB family protein [Desmospora activa]PTM59048.1 tripartite tricarboxylate transporter TctB family protein [Desmospora activa DSM 45169]